MDGTPPAATEHRTLPLFPLSTVLFPGLILPLHVFEPRYRRLLADLTARRESEFGVVTLWHGRETDTSVAGALASVGCVARVRRVVRRPDGTVDLVTVGTQRFRILALLAPAPYLRAEVEMLGDATGDVDAPLVERVHAAYDAYLAALGPVATTSPGTTHSGDLPADPRELSYLVASTTALPLLERQRLLEAPTAEDRLRLALTLLRREHALVGALDMLPATDLTRTGFSAN